jgi:hypothetical protein
MKDSNHNQIKNKHRRLKLDDVKTAVKISATRMCASVIAVIAAFKINKPLSWWKKHLSVRMKKLFSMFLPFFI